MLLRFISLMTAMLPGKRSGGREQQVAVIGALLERGAEAVPASGGGDGPEVG